MIREHAAPKHIQILTGLMTCPKCEGKGTFTNGTLATEGIDKGYPIKFTCGCEVLKLWWMLLRKNVPLHDVDIFLSQLIPSSKSRLKLDKQKEIIEYMKANPNQSYAFFGAAGTSKTTYGVALYENVLWNYVAKYWTDRNGAHQPTIWRKSAKYLLDEFVNFSTSKEVAGKAAKEPSVNRRIIEKAARYGKTPRLFLEEIDKTRYTEFKTAQVFELFDAIYENNGQLVFNSNLTPEEFEKQFFRASDAEALVRRITEAGKVFNFHEEGWTE